ncbi:MAG TPA: hypothetical protein VGG68_14130, partial [Caulobacteraceae bacterium]
REAVEAHNEALVITTTKQIGRATTTTHDFNRAEEFHQLDAVLSAADAGDLTVRRIAELLYGTDDDILATRVRGSLKYGSAYQKTLHNGRAVIARADGTLRITANPDEFGTLVEENTAVAVAAVAKMVRQRTVRLNKDLAAAVDKVPELSERLTVTREQVRNSLSTVFSKQLELLSGLD